VRRLGEAWKSIEREEVEPRSLERVIPKSPLRLA